MRSLLSERFAPTTSTIGFLEVPLAVAADGLAAWRRDLYGTIARHPMEGDLAHLLARLPPLVGGVRPRELLVATSGRWTAYFDCGIRGTDAETAIGHLSQALGCSGLDITCTPHIAGRGGRPMRHGSVQFNLFGPLRTDFLNYVRTVYVAYTGSKWEFGESGTEQGFEEPAAYTARRVRERFTSDMLERYCRALGVEVFDAAAYGPAAVLVESAVKPAPGGHSMSLDEAQQWLGIVPGEIDAIVG